MDSYTTPLETPPEELSPNASVLTLIKEKHSSMTPAQKRIAHFIIENPSLVVKNSISGLAQLTNVKSEASIVRFYRSLGFSGYKEFRIQIAQEMAGQTFYHSTEDVDFTDNPHDIKRKIMGGAISRINFNLNQDDDAAYQEAVREIVKARRIIFLGYAASAAVCYYANFRFLELGLNCCFSSDSHVNAAVMAQPNEGDLIFIISYSGETLDIIHHLDSMPPHSSTILSLTNSSDSTIAKKSDIVIASKTDESNLLTDAMNTRIVQMCTVDALFSMVSVTQGKEAFSRLMKTREVFYDYKNMKPPKAAKETK